MARPTRRTESPRAPNLPHGTIRWIAWLDREMPGGRWSWVLCLGLLGIGVALRAALPDRHAGVLYVTFYPPMVIAAVLWGWRHGAVMLATSVPCAWIPFTDPPWTLAAGDPGMKLRTTMFIASGAVIIAAIAGLRDLNRRLAEAAEIQGALFRELQHRVANNMQILAATLADLRRGTANAEAADLVRQAEARVMAMAQLHRRMYDGDAYRAGLEPILREVLSETLHGLGVRVGLRLNSDGLGLAQMTTVLLLVNEAALNAAKHVFRPRLGQRLEVDLRRIPGGMLQLDIEDDGPGIAPSLATDAAAPSPCAQQMLGMRIMETLARQLGGTLSITSTGRTVVSVTFPAG